MKRLVQDIIELINKRLISGTVNLVKLESFESPIIYMSICKHFLSRDDINLVGIIEINKYNEFTRAGKPEWNAALDYLKTNGFVKEDVPLTKLRNESVTQIFDTSLLLLMGAEAAIDKGSIKDFNSISMVDFVDRIKKDYSKWFDKYLMGIDANSNENSEILNNIYKAVFQYNNIDVMKFSTFIDSLEKQLPENMSELVEYIFSTLNIYWNMPHISRYMPKLSEMKEKKAIKIIISSYEFINNKLTLSPANVKSLPKKFKKFADDNGINFNNPYMGFDSYYEFENAVSEFLKNKRIDEYRAKFMVADFGVINNIFGLKATSPVDERPVKEKDSVVSVSGDPLDIYLQMITYSCLKFSSKFNGCMPHELELKVNLIQLSNCVANDDFDGENDNSLISHYLNICSYMGGLVKFINDKGLNDKQITLRYSEDIDPFNQHNLDVMNGRIKAIKKWGVNSQITFIMTACGQSEEERKSYEFKWAFSPYASWKNAFSLLLNVYDSNIDEKTLPIILCCENMPDYLGCESENEFFIKLESMHYSTMNKEYRRLISSTFLGCNVLDKFNLVNRSFESWCDGIIDSGFFNNIDKMNAMISDYTNMIETATSFCAECSSNQAERMSLFLNCFSIISNEKYLEDGHTTEIIMPSYNPAMLEKINAQIFYTIFSFSELFNKWNDLTEKNYQQKLADIKKLADITQSVDIIPDGVGGSIVCKNVWGYYAVYYGDNSKIPYISNVELVQDEINEDNGEYISESSQSKVIERNVKDYIKTFPARADGLNVCFIAPKEIQYVVAGIGKVAESLSKFEIEAVINIKIICFGGTKDVSGYLRFWLNNYMSKERSVKINTYLRYIQANNISSDLTKLLENQDLCFIYDILKTDTIIFDPYAINLVDEQEQMKYCQFPMTFIPDTITVTHGRKRKVNISQMQFLVSRAYTQLAHKVLEPNSVDGLYKVMQQLALENNQQKVLDIAHKYCRWVVCEDKAIDRSLLQTDGKKIIGFTTGEGCFGEYNVTVSAKDTILSDIQKLLKTRLVAKFNAWNNNMAEKLADNCLALTESFDGSRILKALNPYDYEIHNFLAYALMVKELNINESIDGKYISRNLLNLDSYQHWLKGADSEKRPDFMLIEIPITSDIDNPEIPLKIKIKIIECKMGLHIDNYIEKAIVQVNSGIAALSKLWTSENDSVSRRYWFTQLYRAIAFSKLGVNDSDDNFRIINAKIYNILNGIFEIEWSGDIYAYSLADSSEASELTELDSNEVVSLIKLHRAGQLYVQKRLLPDEMQGEKLVYSNIAENDEEIDADNEEAEDDIEQNYVTELPKIGEILLPFLKFLSSGHDCSRVEALNWFKDYCHFDSDTLQLRYESNGNLKWETILDSAITIFRKNEIIANSSYGVFHITDFGKSVCNKAEGVNLRELSLKLIAEMKEQKVTLINPVVDNKQISNLEKDKISEISDDIAENYQGSEVINETEEKKHLPVSEVRILLGDDIRTKEKYYWEFGNKELNNRHLLINGNSGCGKTYCIQGLLMESALQGISSVVFDYTGGFTNSKLDPVFKNALGDKIKQRIIRVDKIPVNPFVKHDIQIDEDLFVPENDVDVASKIAEIFSTVYSLGDQQKSALYSAVLSGLVKYGDAMSFKVMVDELDKAGTNYAKTVMSKIQTFTDINPFAFDEKFSWGDIRDSEGIVYVIQLTGYGRDIQILLTELLLWDIWSFSVKNGDETKPFVLVLDEAQNLSHGDKSPSAKILTEGRKFGLSGWYATQFMKPQLTDDEIQRLQQAGQKLYFCPPDDGVMAVAKNIDINSQGAREWSEKLKKLKKGECVTCGSMVKNSKWIKYEPKIIKVASLQERLNNE